MPPIKGKSGAEVRLSQAGLPKEFGHISNAVSILKAIANDISYLLFKTIALNNGQIKLRQDLLRSNIIQVALKNVGLIKIKRRIYHHRT